MDDVLQNIWETGGGDDGALGSLFLDFGCHREYTSCVNLLWPGCVSKSALFLICYKPAAPTAGVPSLIQSAFVEESALIAITLSDGAFSSRPGEGASGSIARDHQRQLFASKAIWYPKAANALSMEAHAIRDGVILARYRKVIMETASLVLSKLLNIMESDSLVLSKLLNNGNFKRSEIAYILYDVVELS